ncbi:MULTISPECIES: hypothetical protein [Clostridia]|jgi:hypothetical protein|nr:MULTISPECIES: hypothetical protein [Clostridia]
MKKYKIRKFSPIWWTGWSLAWAAGIAMLWICLCGWAAIPV